MRFERDMMTYLAAVISPLDGLEHPVGGLRVIDQWIA